MFKTSALLGTLILLSACVTDGPRDIDCSKISDPNFRDQCYAEQIQDDIRERNEEAANSNEE